MFCKIKKVVNNVKLIKQDIDEVDKNIKAREKKFKEEWNKWGKKKSNTNKIP